jgi:hypothetical protein
VVPLKLGVGSRKKKPPRRLAMMTMRTSDEMMIIAHPGLGWGVVPPEGEGDGEVPVDGGGVTG